MQVTTSITGTEEIVRKLRLIPEKVGRNAMRRALRKGANVIRDAARNNARLLDDSLTREAIWKNIVVQGGSRRFERRDGGPKMRVGVLGGAKRTGGDPSAPGGDTYYWRQVEFGNSRMAARPFFRNAIASSVEGAISATIAAMNTETDKELRKLGAR